MNRARAIALLVGIIAAALSVIGAFFDGAQFFRSYLFAYLFWLGLALGCFGLTMLHNLVGGRWGFVTRRFFEAGLTTLPLLAVLAVPLCFGLRALYGWANHADVAADPVLQHRHVYLNIPFFLVRLVVFFAIWLGLARALLRRSHEQDATADPEPTRQLRAISAPGLIVYVLTASFAYLDFVLSLEPDWYSTVFLILIVVGQTLAALALGILLLRIFAESEPFAAMLTPTHFLHLGNLMLAFVMLWAYMAFSQLIIIWSGNLPAEIAWYLHRSTPGWKALALALGLLQFAVPFALLLSQDLKRRIRLLWGVAALVLFAHAVDVFWLVVPSFGASVHAGGRAALHWMDFTIFAGIGGFWVALFLTRLAAHPLIPRNDPRMAASVQEEGVPAL